MSLSKTSLELVINVTLIFTTKWLFDMRQNWKSSQQQTILWTLTLTHGTNLTHVTIFLMTRVMLIFKFFCNWICNYKSFLPCAIGGNHKNGRIGHKPQTHELVWTRFFIRLKTTNSLNSLIGQIMFLKPFF